MRGTLACGLVLAALLGGAVAAPARDLRFSFGVGMGHGGHHYYRPGYYRPMIFARPSYAFRPYTYPYFAGPGYAAYRPFFYRPYDSPRVIRYYVPPRAYRPYRTDQGVRYDGRDRGYVDYIPRRYHRPW